MIAQPLFLGGIEIAAIIGIIILLFGASKLPELARASGQATKEFERGRQQSEQEVEELREELETEESEEEQTEELS